MKLVINKCYGGYSISPLAVKRLAELQGKECFFFDHAENPLTLEQATEKTFFSAYCVSDPDTQRNKTRKGKAWCDMTKAEKSATNAAYEAINLTARPENRSDPLLIQVVEELGVKAASGKLAKLEIVEIPDDVNWQIEDYDGIETIHELHRSW